MLAPALGAMAAERVFYGENSTGVGGDVQSATARAAWMVGACGMAPEPVELNGSGNGRVTKATLDKRREEINKRLEQIGTQTEIYLHPRTPFVAEFIGATNGFSGTVTGRDGEVMQAVR